VDRDRRGHDALAVGGDSVETLTGDLGEKPVSTQLGDLATGALASGACFGIVTRVASVEPALQIGVAKPDDSVLSGHDGEVVPLSV